jgi:uncharacterized protein YciI
VPPTDTRLVVFHTPGPRWKPGVDFRSQPGVAGHVAHYGKLMEQGRLDMGGPFLSKDAGGMMVASSDVTLDQLEAFASTDPAVASGLLHYEIRSWYVAMNSSRETTR